MRDLGSWASEKYVVSEPVFDEDELPEAERRALHQAKQRTDEAIH